MPAAPPKPRRISPGRPTRRLRSASPRGDWDGALKLVDSQKATRQIERDAANRRRAVLLTAKAQALFDTDPAAARQRRARGQQAAARFRAGRRRRRQGAVQAERRAQGRQDPRGGMAQPSAHPDVGALYVHARPGDAVNDRLNRARKLQSMKQNNAESALLVARAALEAGDYKAAREAGRIGGPHGAARRRLPAARRHRGGRERRPGPRPAISVEGGARAARSGLGRRRRRLRRWAPVSPVTGRLDAFEWRAPVERLGH